ncbi:agglutinin biogenesis protein MshP [Rugamonas sp.]|uniref:pilus assembly PilX family protein n=1 Tax=Rugamonas sp. TaxID=1926287 RepID=UPI0025FF2EB6|nr:agglutinin biogenesis protein MshP [Rugamonas sp.]
MNHYAAIHRLRRARGIAMVTAIFLLVVLAGLAVAIVSVTTTQQASQSMDLLGVRAYQAARAGMEWAVYQGAYTKAGQAPTTSTAFCGTSFNKIPAPSLASFTVTITCIQEATPLGSPPGGGTAPTSMRVLSVACNQPVGADATHPGTCPNNNNAGVDYVERQVEAEI